MRSGVLLLMSLAGIAGGQTLPAETPARTAQVPSNRKWNPSTLTVEQGKCYTLAASGEWKGADQVACGPKGTCPESAFSFLGPQPEVYSSAEDLKKYYYENQPRNALIARFAGEKWSFAVGDKAIFLAPVSGTLEFRINDTNEVSKVRSGSMQVSLMEVQPHWVDDRGQTTIYGLIDASDLLHFTPQGIQWEYGGSWEKPGRFKGNFPTIVNGIFWWPAWDSPTRTDVLPVKELWPGNASRLKIVSTDAGRGSVAIEYAKEGDVALRLSDKGGGPSTIGATLFVGTTAAAPGKDILATMHPAANTEVAKTDEGTRLLSKDKGAAATLSTGEAFTIPVTISTRVKTSKDNIRLTFGEKGLLIFDWEGKGSELRFHDPRSGQENGVAGQGAIPRDQWANIEWTITESESRVVVNGVQRAVFKNDYAGLSGRVGIGTFNQSALTIRSLKVQPVGAEADNGLPATKEIAELIDARKYQPALAALARVLQLKGAAASRYDRHELLMLKAECLLQLRDQHNLLATLNSAAGEAKSPAEEADAVALQELVGRSVRDLYTGKKDGAAHDILDRAHRTDAFAALWTDEFPPFESETGAAISGDALPAIFKSAKAVPVTRAVEFKATGSSRRTDEIAGKLKERAAKLIDSVLEKDGGIVDHISAEANRTVRVIDSDTGRVLRTYKKGLTMADPRVLGDVEADCSQIVTAAQDLARVFTGDNTFRDLAATAVSIGQKANHTRTAQY
jgi:hypothetical protein